MTTADFTKYPDVVKTLACPQCGSEDLATIEQITGIARAEITTNDVHYAGETDIQWDTSTTVGVQCHERECEWFYVGKDWQDQLAVVGEDETPEVHHYELTITVLVDETNPEDAVTKAIELLRTTEVRSRFSVRDEHGYVVRLQRDGLTPQERE